VWDFLSKMSKNLEYMENQQKQRTDFSMGYGK
jgi:hypothetical protein